MFKDRRGYWYRTRRTGGRVVREYLGTGAVCEAEAYFERGNRQTAGEAKEAQRAQREDLDTSEREDVAAFRAVTVIVRAALEAHGYHQHARGQWRKRRAPKPEVKPMTTALTNPNTAPATVTPAHDAASPPVKVPSKVEVRKGLEAARKDPQAARKFFGDLEARSPAAHDAMIDLMANMGRTARGKILELGTSDGPDELVSEAHDRRLRLMREELEQGGASALERLLIERILNGWMQVHRLELLMNIQRENSFAVEYDKRLERAHKRYLAAIKSLAQVRKLQLPAVQVNIAEKQVNISQGGGTS